VGASDCASSTFTAQYLQELHAGHQGVVRTKALARAHVWWPGLGKEIEALVTSCAACAANGSCPALVEISPMPWPREPWSRLHLDLAGPFCGRNFLVLVDAHSKWMEVKLLKSTTSTAVIRKLESLFAYWGCPDVIVTDNGPQFISEEFGSFCSKYGTLNTTVSPYHPRSNGQAELAVATFKTFIRKLQHINDVKQELNKFLMHYRITTHSLTGQCPAKLMLGRTPHTRLDLIHPSVAHIERRQGKMVEQGPQVLREFSVGDYIW